MKKFKSINKRVLALLLSILMLLTSGIISAVAVTVDLAETGATIPAGTYFYLKPNSNWTQSNARFAAYFFNNSTKKNTWVSMTANGDGTYKVTIPDGTWPNVIFCRMNPSTTANNWDKGVKWHQTLDLTIPTDGKNLYTVKDGTWDKGGGSWSTK